MHLFVRNSDNVEEGGGGVALNDSYSPAKTPPLEVRQVWRVRKGITSGDIVYVEKKDSHRSYAMTTVHTSDFLPRSKMASYDHPFIAPLKFSVKSSNGGLHLLSPLASGGQLFGHL